MYWPFPRELNMRVVGVCVVDVNRVLVRCCWATDDFDFCKVIGHIVILDTDAKNVYEKDDTCLKKTRMYIPNMTTILGSIVIMIGGPIWLFNEHENLLHCDNGWDIHTNSKDCEGSGYGPNSKFANHLVQTFVSYPKRSLVVKNRPIYLTSHETGVGEGSSNKVSGEIFVHNQS